MKNNILYIVVPCYNEEEVLTETTKQLKTKLEDLIEKKVIAKESRVMYVNDGSKDKTWQLIEKISKENELFTGISLSRNRGHQNALLAGLMTAKEYADITSDSLAKIVSDSNNIANAFDEMSKANEIQAKNANDIRNEIENISQVVQSNTATAQQTAASTEVLSEQAAALKDMTGRFKVDY